jgi:hypothetical protein
MKFLCFPHYTAGGLLCDIFENKFSQIGPHGGIVSLNHQLGKIGDSDSIFVDFDTQKFHLLLSTYQNTDITVGTHCWPGNMCIPTGVEVILITTETTKSKIYRWLRAWHLYFSKTDIVKSLSGIDLLDKQRELAKNYLKPFSVVPNASNLEFADIVETTAEFYSVIKNLPIEQHMTRWKQINHFLYDPSLWNNELVQRYYEAEFEIAHGRYYQYN